MRPRVRSLLVASLALVLFTGVVAAQFDRPRVSFSFTTRFLGSLVVNLLVGAIVVGLAPEYADETVTRVRSEPGTAVLAGVAVLVGFLGTVFLLALFGPLVIFGLLLAIPMLVVGVVGGTLGTIAAGTALVDAFIEATLWRGLLVGSVFYAVLNAIPVIGRFLAFLVGSAGVGVVCLRLYEGW